MPAKPLTPGQIEDAVRLKQAFNEWQHRRREEGKEWSQEFVSDLLGFGQSALSQYINGLIPLNGDALQKFTKLIGVNPMSISPSIVRAEREKALTWLDPAPSKVIPAPIEHVGKAGLQKTAGQKKRLKPATKKQVK